MTPKPPRTCLGFQGADKERFNRLAEELSQLSTKFSNNVLDATKAFRKLVTDRDLVAGLPHSALALAAQQVRTLLVENSRHESGHGVTHRLQ